MDLRDRSSLHPEGRPLVIGHRGAARVAPENSLEGLAAAVAAGADLVEFDVERRADDAALVLGHPGVAPAGAALELDAALAYLESQPIGVHVDLKLVGAERELAASVRAHGVGERTVVTSTWARSLRRLATEAPELTRAISYPRDRYGASVIPWPRPVVRASAAALRAAMGLRAPLLLTAAAGDALSLHHALVSPAIVRRAHRRGPAVIAWTVNDPGRVEELARSQVDAIVSDDPQMAVAVLATLKTPKMGESR
jgi:glycerophosphoryl diester phosphodiesterase